MLDIVYERNRMPTTNDFRYVARHMRFLTHGKNIRVLCVSGKGELYYPFLDAALGERGIERTIYVLNQPKRGHVNDGLLGYREINGIVLDEDIIKNPSEIEIVPAEYNMIFDDDTDVGWSIAGGVLYGLENFDGKTIVVIYNDKLHAANLYVKGNSIVPPQIRIRDSDAMKRILKRNAPAKTREFEAKGLLDKLIKIPIPSLGKATALTLKGWCDYYIGSTRHAIYRRRTNAEITNKYEGMVKDLLKRGKSYEKETE